MKEISNKFIPVIILFILINVAVLVFKSFLQLKGFDINFLLISNLLLFILSITGFFMQIKAVKSANINAFLRGVYSSLLLKIFAVIIVLGIYLFTTGGKVNNYSLFVSMAFYIVYTAIEVRQLMKIYRRKPNA